MKTLYLTRTNNIVLNSENNAVSQLNDVPYGINNAFYITEPMHVVFGYKEDKAEADVVPGDIVIVFYRDEFPNKFAVVKNDIWSANLAEYLKKEQEKKERWAQSNSERCSCCEDCEN